MPKDSATNYDPDLGRKFIFVTGGVMSGLGKGITAASTGRLLKNAGFDVTAVKIDPYLNVDAGTMNPYQHGEVYVLKDGGEVDLDLGNYERFLDIDMTFDHNVTTGKVYQQVIEAERAGDYLARPSRSSRTSPTTSSGASARPPPEPTSASSRSVEPSATSRGCLTSKPSGSSPTRKTGRHPVHPRHARPLLDER